MIYQIRTNIKLNEKRTVQRLLDLKGSSHPEDAIFYRSWYDPEGSEEGLWFYEYHLKVLSKEFPHIEFWTTVKDRDDTTLDITVIENGQVIRMYGQSLDVIYP